MTKGELELMRAMLREELAPVIKRVEVLEEGRRNHSIQVRAIKTQDLPLMQSETKLALKDESEAMGLAFNRMAIFVNDIAENVATVAKDVTTIKDQQTPRSVVKIADQTGRVSERPASQVAAESSLRTEKTAIDVAADTTLAKNNSAAAKKVGTATLVVSGLFGLLEIIKFIASVLPHQ
jgi:hypothetical protein